ncbi:MAG: serine hydrolase family protein [Polyangiaceae bacterium]|nr:serine hydrolase family protein [Polyangiaceae bacterium]
MRDTSSVLNSDVLLLPGWMGSDAEHWQSKWELLHGACRVVQDEWHRPDPEAWVRRLEEVVAQREHDVVLVAHSLGCHLVTRWAAQSKLAHRIRFALLVAPPDLAREDAPLELCAWTPLSLARLPFPSTLVFSTNDPFCDSLRAQAFAKSLGATAQSAGLRGHMNSASGLGAWPEGLDHLREGLSSAPTVA